MVPAAPSRNVLLPCSGGAENRPASPIPTPSLLALDPKDWTMRSGLLLALGALLAVPAVGSAQIAAPGARAKPAAQPPTAAVPIMPAATDAETAQQPAPSAPLSAPPASPANPPTISVVPVVPPPANPRFWGSAEYLLWSTKAVPVPTPTITAATNIANPTSGQLGSPDTAVLLGGQSYSMIARSGGRFTIGTWLDPAALLGIEGTYLFIAPTTTLRAVSSNGTVPIGLPFFDVTTGSEGFAPLAIPGLQSGAAFLGLTNRLQSGEFNGTVRLLGVGRLALSGLVGFRYIDFQEDLNFGFAARAGDAAPLPGAHFDGFDRFNVNNNFFGGQVGLRGEYRAGSWFVSATGKCALGNVDQTASVSGGFAAFAPTIPFPPTSFTGVGGFYALPTNMGQHTHSAFAVAPEGTVNIGYEFGPRLCVFAGYSFLYINNVERPGTAIQHAVNTSVSPGFVGAGGTLVGPAVPSFVFTRSDFWAQGVNFGVLLRY
jgi:hypothetical protein